MLKSFLERDPKSVLRISAYGHDRVPALHLAASSGRIEILSMLLDHGANPDLFNRQKQTPLMLAAMHAKISGLEKLIQAGANMLMFDSVQGRTCLHYAALYGHPYYLQSLLSSAHSSPVAASWGFTRFVNIRNKKGSTPLHLAARQRHAECVHILLDRGALVSASTGGSSYCGSTPLHLAALGGSLDCVRDLLAHGADRLQCDSAGFTSCMISFSIDDFSSSIGGQTWVFPESCSQVPNSTSFACHLRSTTHERVGISSCNFARGTPCWMFRMRDIIWYLDG